MRLSPIVLVGLALALLTAGYLGGRGCAGSTPQSQEASTVAREPAVWTCSMHPSVRLPEAGQCPICFMDLIPSDSGGAEALGPAVLSLSEEAARRAAIRTAPVERRSVAHEVHMVGKVALDETRLATITARVAGRLERLFVDYTGVPVRADDHLVEIYSPTLYAAQQELLQAIATAERLEGSSLDLLRDASDQTVVSSRAKLRLYGLDDAQIEAIVERGEPLELITLNAPIGGVVVEKHALEGLYVEEGSRIYTIADLSKVWVLLDAYESDLAWLRYGQDVEFRVEAYPGEVFHGRVAFIDPVLDDRTRTVKLRLNVDNARGLLKPDMFVSASAHAVLTSHGKVVDEDLADHWMCPMHPEVVAEAEGACWECGMDLAPAAELGFVPESEVGESLVIPHTAPLWTGERAVVYVRLPGREKPTFEGREVRLGPRAGDWVVVREGLKVGEEVVVQGNFKLDSELQIRARPSMMNPREEEAPGEDTGSEEARSLAVPSELRVALGRALEEALALQAALAEDRDDPESAGRLVRSVAAVHALDLAGDAARAWEAQRHALEFAAEELGRAEELAGRRERLAPFSRRLIRALETFGYEHDAGAVRVFHCPMAADGEGADWLQVGAETVNPYMGAAMLRCGSETRRLEPGR